MKKFSIPFFALLFIAFASSFAAAKWYAFQSKEFGYSIDFPSKPTEQIQELDSEVGKITLNLQMYEVPANNGDDNYFYLSNATVYPAAIMKMEDASATENYYRGAVDGAVSNTNGTLLYERPYLYKKLEGREIGIQIEEGLIRMRILLDGNVVYMVQTISPLDKDDNANMHRFMSSFKLN